MPDALSEDMPRNGKFGCFLVLSVKGNTRNRSGRRCIYAQTSPADSGQDRRLPWWSHDRYRSWDFI